jgi:hypothetical protein
MRDAFRIEDFFDCSREAGFPPVRLAYVTRLNQPKGLNKMRKLMMIFALAAAYVAVSNAGSFPPPTCDPNCPWIR